jgi:hypothetical protein
MSDAGETPRERRKAMPEQDNLKRNDQIYLLETCQVFTDTGEWKGIFTYPNCGYDLVLQGLVTEDRKITAQGKTVLWLLGKGPDQTSSKSFEVFELSQRKKD